MDRSFLATSTAAGFAALPLDVGSAQQTTRPARWSPGAVERLLPTVDHQNILIKVSFWKPLAPAPWLSVDGRRFRGRRTDTEGSFWTFHAGGPVVSSAGLHVRGGPRRL